MGSPEIVPARVTSDRRTDWLDHCPLRDRETPEYQLLLSTIRDEIATAMERADQGRFSMFYQRINTLLLILAIIAGSAAWIWH